MMSFNIIRQASTNDSGHKRQLEERKETKIIYTYTQTQTHAHTRTHAQELTCRLYKLYGRKITLECTGKKLPQQKMM